MLLRTAYPYALALLIPVALALGLMGWAAGNLIRAERTGAELELAAQARELRLTVDEAAERAQAAAYSLWRNDDVSPLLRAEPAASHAGLYRVVRELNALTLVNNRVLEDIALVFHQRELVLTSGGRTEPEEARRRFFPEDGAETFADLALEFTSGRLILRPDGRMVFYQTYPVTPRGEESRAMLLMLLRQEFPEGGMMADEHTGALLYNAVDFPGPLDQTLLPGKEGTAEAGGWLLAYEKSRRLPVVYLSCQPLEALSRHAAALWGMVWLASAVCLAADGVLSFLIAKRQTDPLRSLAGLARGQRAPFSSRSDPYAEIQAALLDGAQQRLFSLSMRGQGEAAEQLRLLAAALKDQALSPQQVLPYAQAAKIDCEKRPVCLILLTCADADADLMNISAEQTPLSLAGSLMTNLLSGRWQARAAQADPEYLIFLLPGPGQLDGFGPQINQAVSQAQRLLRDAYGIDTLAAVSGLRIGIQGLLAAYAETEQTLRLVSKEAAPPAQAEGAETENKLYRDTVEFVQQHYDDPNLNVSMAASMLGYSVEYLSRTFKRLSGEGLLTYIHMVQVEKAKALFQENSSLTVRQAAGMTGFASCETFIRVFKRHAGVTPGRFRELLQSEGKKADSDRPSGI